MNFKKTWKRFFSLSRRSDGFTLVELIVVIAILAILGGVAVPAYSGYVEKAERANDEALLNEINTAFVSACMMNGANNYRRTDVKATLNGGIFTYEEPFGDNFNDFFEGGEFKAFEALIYNAKAGAFEEATAVALQIYNTLKENYGDEIATLMASKLGAMGAETLLTEAGSAVDWANTFGLAAMGGEPYWEAVKSYFGLSNLNLDGLDSDTRYRAIMLSLKETGVTEDVAGSMMANATALYAAQNTAGVTADSVSRWLTGSSTTDSFKDNPNATTLAEAAAIYGLYMSYQGDSFSNQNGNVLAVMTDALTDPTFASWVGTDEGKAELEAYKASMAIVNGATGDEETKNTILTNGLDDPDLIGVLESLMGN